MQSARSSVLADGVRSVELDVQRGERATARARADRAGDRSRALSTNTSRSTSRLVIVEHDVLVGRLGRRDRHQRIPALAGRELIQPMRLAAEPLEDAAAGQPHHLAERRARRAARASRAASDRCRAARAEPRSRPCARRHRCASRVIATARRARDRVGREPREPDDDRAGEAEPGDRALDRHAPRLAAERSDRGHRSEQGKRSCRVS